LIEYNWKHDLAYGIGALGQIAYLADLLKPHLTVWPAVALVTLPYWIILMFRLGEMRASWVVHLHLVAALWFLALFTYCVLSALRGYHPEGWLMFFAFMAAGVFVSIVAISRFRFFRRELERWP
jgi:hypothetical protein